MLRFFVTTRLFSSSSSRPAAPRAPLFRIALPPCNLLFANEGEMIDHLKTNPPISFPVFVGSNIFFGAHGSRLGLDVEIDIIFANNELEEKLLAVEVKHVSTHAQRFKQRRKSKGQAIIASQLCAETFGKSSLGGVFSSESPHEISIWSEFVMHTPRLCKEHNLIELPSVVCSIRNPCRIDGCSLKYPCKSVRFNCRKGCSREEKETKQKKS